MKTTWIPYVSRSIDVLKKACNEEDDYFETATDVINEAINEEMVVQSTRQGLPIIPFPCPNFVIIDKNFEDTKVLIRDNSYKDLEPLVNRTLDSQHCDTPLLGPRETRKVFQCSKSKKDCLVRLRAIYIVISKSRMLSILFLEWTQFRKNAKVKVSSESWIQFSVLLCGNGPGYVKENNIMFHNIYPDNTNRDLWM